MTSNPGFEPMINLTERSSSSERIKVKRKRSSSSERKKTKTECFIGSFIKKSDGKPTDAFGDIEFGSDTTKTAKYVKVTSKTDPSILYQLLTRCWKLKTPNLIISVTGGAKNFSLRTRLNEVFRKSLIKAAESTGAWITTAGTHAGVMKHVGKAVENYAAIRNDQNKLVTIGIAPWGVIHGNEKLENNQDELQTEPKLYDAEENSQKNKVILNHNHSHFILVDDGSEGEYGREINLRTKFESFIANQLTNDGIKIMIVCVIVQGGPGSLKTVAGSIDNGTPVVIVEGSGGWADIVAVVKDVESVSEKDVMRLLEERNMELDLSIKELTSLVNTCISKKNLLSVFKLDPANLSKDLDVAILEALMKAKVESQTQVRDRLELAMALNRSDFARSHIFTDDMVIGKKVIAEMFFRSLRSNKHKFCKVFLDYGVDLKEYCTVNDILTLYVFAPKDSAVYQKMSKSDFKLQKLGRYMAKLLGRSYSIYEKREQKLHKYSAVVFDKESDRKSSNFSSSLREDSKAWSAGDKMEDPYREIFQWALLVNYREIAMHIWERMFGSMAAAVIATKILKVKAAKLLHYDEKKEQMLADADKYEKLAVGILGQCFLDDPHRTTHLLTGTLPKWGGYTCLNAATESNDKIFVSRPAAQRLLDIVWKGHLADKTSAFHILVAGICPLFIFTTIDFKTDDDSNNRYAVTVAAAEESDVKHRNDEDIERGDRGRDRHVTGTSNIEDLRRTSSCSPVKKLKKLIDFFAPVVKFYNAPVVKFWMNVLAFSAFLAFFAFVILSDFSIRSVSISVFEYILLGWISTYFLEELRQIEFRWKVARIMKMVMFYSKQMLGFTSFTLFYIGFILRWYDQFLHEALILYALAFMIQCLYIVRIFAIHPVLGPKIIMVKKMLKDVLFFLFILIVFLLAYGVASQALLYPTEKNFGEILVGILYRPYWEIYGELFLDEINYNPKLDDFTCSDTDASLPRCPQPSAAVPIISAVYLLLANVLLLNLLIAMFSHTFENVEKRRDEIWKFHRYKLITSYLSRPPFVPPLIVITYIYRIMIYLMRKVYGKKDVDSFSNTLRMDLSKIEGKLGLRKWERWQADAFLKETHENNVVKAEHQWEKLSDRMDNITSSIEDMQDQLRGLRAHGSSPLKPNEGLEKKEVTSKPVSSLQEKSKAPQVELHKKSRTKCYPNSAPQPNSAPRPNSYVQPVSSVCRTEVPDDKVPWEINWDEYDPKPYTATEVKNHPVWADADIHSLKGPRFPFNEYDPVKNVDRKSYLGTYAVVDGMPRNPRGRTGISGRGELGRYGPNHAADPVVTRWKRLEGDQIARKKDKPVLEFIAIKREDNKEWALPGGMVGPEEEVYTTLKKRFCEKALDINDSGFSDEVGLLFKSGGLELLKGYCDDHRNTDNAWIETVACNFHDEDGKASKGIELKPGKGATEVAWKEVNDKLKLFASHKEVLRKVADAHNAYFSVETSF